MPIMRGDSGYPENPKSKRKAKKKRRLRFCIIGRDEHPRGYIVSRSHGRVFAFSKVQKGKAERAVDMLKAGASTLVDYAPLILEAK